MRRINCIRLFILLSSIIFIILLAFGVWHLKGEFKTFESKYIEQRNIEFIEAKYKKSYSIWQQEKIAECIANARKEPIDYGEKQNWLDSLSSDTDKINSRINICNQSFSMVPVPRNEVRIAYIKYKATSILIYILVAVSLTWLFCMLFIYWLPSFIRKLINWLTTTNNTSS